MLTYLAKNRKLKKFKNSISSNEGFTLVELMIVIAIISVFAIIVVPKFTNFFDSRQKHMNTFKGYISKTFDDAFIKAHINFLAIHLHSPMSADDSDDVDRSPVFSRENGLSLLRFKDGEFVEVKNKIFTSLKYPDSFKIETVILSDGTSHSEGTVLVPYYPDGYSDNVIIHVVLSEEETVSIIINKFQKEPEVIGSQVSFEDYWGENNDQ